MVRSITFKHRKNSKSEFETCLVLTEHAFNLIHKHNQKEKIHEFIDYLLSFSKTPENSMAEIIYQLPKIKEGKSIKNFQFNFTSLENSTQSDLQKRYLTLTEQEKKIFNFIIRNFKQKQICKALNIKVNTEKGYRKTLRIKMEISDFSKISDSDRELLLRFAYKK